MHSAAPHVLVIIQNLPFRLDRRVRSECRALTDAGYRVSVICPQENRDEPARFDIDDTTVYSYPAPPESRGLAGYVREFVVCWLRTARASGRVHRDAPFQVIQACNPPDTYWLLAVLWRLRRGVRFVYDQHDLCPEVYLAKFGQPAELPAARPATAVTANLAAPETAHRTTQSVAQSAAQPAPRQSAPRRALHGLLYRALLLLERATYRSADHVISTNTSYQQIAQGRGRVDPGRSSVVLSTPDADLMQRRDPEPGARDLGEQDLSEHSPSEHSLSEHSPSEHSPTKPREAKHLVCYVGIMGSQDGVDRLLAAVDHVVHRRGRTDVRFVLLGFGDALEDLRADCTRRGLDRWVHFTGRVDHGAIGRWLSSADLGVTPDPPSEFNDRSTMNKTLEYMAHELPVVATDLTETRRSAGDAARYVAGSDAAPFGDAILEILDDPERARAMGRAGRARIVGELSWKRQAETYVGVFDRLTNRTGATPVSHG